MKNTPITLPEAIEFWREYLAWSKREEEVNAHVQPDETIVFHGGGEISMHIPGDGMYPEVDAVWAERPEAPSQWLVDCFGYDGDNSEQIIEQIIAMYDAVQNSDREVTA